MPEHFWSYPAFAAKFLALHTYTSSTRYLMGFSSHGVVRAERFTRFRFEYSISCVKTQSLNTPCV